MLMTKVSSKFQLCIPKHVREELNIKAGQQFVFMTKGDIIHLVPVRNIKEVKGILSGANPSNYRDHVDRV